VSCGGRHGDEGRADDAVAQPIAAPDLLDDLALGPVRAGTLAIASCSRGSNGRPAPRRSRVTPSLSSSRRACDRWPRCPRTRVLGDRRRSRLDGTVEVVGEHEHLADEVLAGEPEVAHPLLGRAPLEVLELGPLALERAEVLVGGRARRVALAGQRLDLGDQRGRRDVDVVRALLGAGAVSVRHRDDPRARS
jgi:hypothetical protein